LTKSVIKGKKINKQLARKEDIPRKSGAESAEKCGGHGKSE
jgi:hypothetical protein